MPGPFRVVQNSLTGSGEGSFTGGLANRLGMQVVCDFYTYMGLTGAGFQVRAGTITTPLVGDVVITDTAAEMSADAAAGTTIIPVGFGLAVRLATGTLFEHALKSVAAVSTAGTAFVPLPLRTRNVTGGTAAAAVSTARVSAAGGVTVTAELATTTLRHWEFSNPIADAAGSDVGLATVATTTWNPKVPPVLVGPWCFYAQIAATTTGPSYYAHFDYIEVPTLTLL